MKCLIVTMLFFLTFYQPSNIRADNETSISPVSFEVEPLAWDIVDTLLPRYSKFTVIDWETGKTFQVQRRAGKNHTDVQPLTHQDTKIMKDIYGGKWSWKRRAILVKHKDYLIAASMHGMPHGAGALQNNFPGHFCIHFTGSTTHRSKKMDLSHRLMIMKSAGEIKDYIAQSTSDELIHAFIEALDQKDPYILNLIFSKDWNKNKDLVKWISSIDSIKINEESPLLQQISYFDSLTTEVPVKITLYSSENGKEKGTLILQLTRLSYFHNWRIVHETLKFIPV
jgi:hypothetical protein